MKKLITTFSLSLLMTLSVFAQEAQDPLTNGGLNATDNTNIPDATILTPSDDEKETDITEEELLSLLEEGLANGDITEEEAAELYEEAFGKSEGGDSSENTEQNKAGEEDYTEEQLSQIKLVEQAFENGDITEEEATALVSEILGEETLSQKPQKITRESSELKYDISVLKTFPGATEQKGMTFLGYKSKKYLSQYVSCKGDENATIGNSLKSLKLKMGALKPVCRQEVTYQYLPYRTYRKSRR